MIGNPQWTQGFSTKNTVQSVQLSSLIQTLQYFLREKVAQFIFRIPSYRQHKAPGQAIVTLGGQDHYLGVYGSAVGKREHKRFTAEWLAAGRQFAPNHTDQLKIGQFIARFWRHVEDVVGQEWPGRASTGLLAYHDGSTMAPTAGGHTG